MEEPLWIDRRSIRLVFETDRQADNLLAMIYQRLLTSTSEKRPQREIGSVHMVVDCGRPVSSEVKP